MLQIINSNEGNIWNNIVNSFKCWDVYYLYEYAYSLYLHGDGIPLLIYYENGGERFCYVVMQNDIADYDKFEGVLPHRILYDWETPYGYGGPLSEGEISVETQRKFAHEIRAYCNINKIVSQFIRFSPLLHNEKLLSEVIENKYVHNTVYMDTASPDLILKNMDTKNRNMVRKAKKNHVEVFRKDVLNLQDFVSLYEQTMRRNHASDYYNFSNSYFDYLCSMRDNIQIFYAMYENRTISAAIFFYNDRFMHYHLSGSDYNFRKLAPNNLLLYEAACWAAKRKILMLHLGGGMATKDSLFEFKKKFNKKGEVPFFVGRTIFCPDRYGYLLKMRHIADKDFNEDNDYMIQYRR